MDFFDIVAPRLANLHIVSGLPLLVGPILNEYGMAFPDLRVLTVSPPASGCSGRERDCYLVTFSGASMPKLVDLSVHADLRMTFWDHWPVLQAVNCTGEGLDAIEPLVRSAGTLRRLSFNLTYEWFGDIDVTPPDAEVLAALRAISDVHITTELAPVFVEQIFGSFGASTAPLLQLTFRKCDHYTGSFQPRACGRISSAVRLRIVSSVDPGSTHIILEDDAARSTRITLVDIPPSDEHPAVDWEMVDSLESLTCLHVDAALWPEVMRNFPSTPRLTELVLAIHATADLERVLDTAQRADLPQAASLTLVSETDVISLDPDCVQRLKTAVGASHLSLSSMSTSIDVPSNPGQTMQ